ncbi:MAG: hypothetical protein IKH04_00585 [Kiritimatiellae bacterium]|nr:hypothetical protein [Kiritimatiellia bacterium]
MVGVVEPSSAPIWNAPSCVTAAPVPASATASDLTMWRMSSALIALGATPTEFVQFAGTEIGAATAVFSQYSPA